MLKKTLLIIFLVYTNYALAQEYNIEHYTDDNGLPQNSVKSIALDNAGFVWLATENGPVRFDGQKFLLFDKSETKASSNKIVDIKKDIVKNKLYALTDKKQLIELINGRVIPHPVWYKNVFKIKNTTDSNVYFTGGVPNLLNKNFNTVPYIIPATKSTYYKIADNSIKFYGNNQLIHSYHFKYESKWLFFLFNNSLFYFNSKNELFKFKNGVSTKIFLKSYINSSSPIKLFWNSCTNNIFIGFKNGLYLLKEDKSGSLFLKETLKNINYNNLDISSIYMDKKNGSIYIGSYTKGLHIFKEKKFKSLNPDTILANNGFYAQYPFKDNAVLYANGYIIQSDGVFSSLNLVKKHSDNFSLLIDKEKYIWAAKGSTLYKISPNGQKIITTHKLPENISCLYQAPNNEIWIGTYKGIFTINNTSYIRQKGLENIKDISFIKKANEKLWVATHNGLFYFDFIDKKQYVVKGLNNKDIRSIYARNNEIWITTYGDGFYLYKKNELIQFPDDFKGYLKITHCILEDKNGFFWISTNKGLFQVAIADLLAYAQYKTAKVFYQYYNKSYGFTTNEFNGGCQPCGSVLNNGYFSFPTLYGTVSFNPNLIDIEQPNRPIFIEKVLVNDQKIIIKNKLKVPIDFERLAIYLTTPYFGNKENLNFEYKLNDQKQWTQAVDQVISYTSLPAGKNKLFIRKANGFGYNNYAYKIIIITVPLHFYQTWLFIVSVITLLIAMVYFLIKYRIRVIQKRNHLLEKNIYERTKELQNTIQAYETSQNQLKTKSHFQRRLIAAITHDIKSPLQYLMITGEALFKNTDRNNIDYEGLKAIYSSSSQIYHFTDNLLKYAKGLTNEDLNTKTQFILYDLVNEKINIFKAIAKSQATYIYNCIDKKIILRTNRQLLSVILHNLLDNAIKFTKIGSVSFRCEVTKSDIKILISDTGTGMRSYLVNWFNEDCEKQCKNTTTSAGLGLIMVKELMQIIGGKINVQSYLGKGTTFEIILPN